MCMDDISICLTADDFTKLAYGERLVFWMKVIVRQKFAKEKSIKEMLKR